MNRASIPASAAPPLIEQHTIGYIPPDQRHGRVRDLFTLWFGGNIAPLPMVTGALGVQVFHLNLPWCVAAIITGQLLGGVLMALHSAQGPQLGIPQMIQSRAQFGSPRALLAYGVGIVVQLPFMNTPLYTGPVSQWVSGADLSWLVGLLVTTPLYGWLARRAWRATPA